MPVIYPDLRNYPESDRLEMLSQLFPPIRTKNTLKPTVETPSGRVFPVNSVPMREGRVEDQDFPILDLDVFDVRLNSFEHLFTGTLKPEVFRMFRRKNP